MPGSWWTRLIFTVLSALWGTWMVIPMFTGETSAERNERIAAQSNDGVAAPTEEAPWYEAWLPTSRMVLGLDLQGGIELTLQVDVDEAVLSVVQRDVRPLLAQAQKDGVAVEEVERARGEAALHVRMKDGSEVGPLLELMKKGYGNYTYANTVDKGGLTWHVFTLNEDQAEYVRRNAVEQALTTLRNRIDETGVKEPSITQKGMDQINVQLPGIDNIEQATQAVGKAAVLEFMLVNDEKQKESGLVRLMMEMQSTAPPEALATDEALNNWMHDNGHLAKGDRLMFEYVEGADRKKTRNWDSGFYIVHDEVLLTGDDVNSARVEWDSYGKPYVSLEFKAPGARIFCELTEQNTKKAFAIVLDKEVQSAPVINEAICGGRAQISMGTQDVAQAQADAALLSLVLKTGALPAPVTVGEVRQVGSQLGEDAIAAGIKASLVGGGIVVAFMVMYYRASGMMACIALSLNMLLVMAMMTAAGATLTLPGITGMALTIGMAVDCNIIIFERIREELRLGKSAKSATEAGFDKALWAILDGNITTFIAGVVLYSYGSGPIKGFAVTLMIGIVTTLFTGVMVSQVLMDWLVRKTSARLSI
jgi:preprotein translocase subunit SecD